MTIHTLFICFVLATSSVTGAIWSPVTEVIWSSFSPHHHHHQRHRVVIEFEEQIHGNTKVSVSQLDDSSLFDKLKSADVSAFEKPRSLATEVIDNTVGKAGEKAINGIGKSKTEVGKVNGPVTVADKIEGALKDSVVKLEEWDPVDSPKRIGEDIGHNMSAKIEEGVEEVKETVEKVMETSPPEVVTRSKTAINDVLNVVLLGSSVTGWCHLLGFSTACGMGVWVTFFLGCVLGKCLPKGQSILVLNMMNMVYFRAMGYCVAVALIGFLVGQGRRGCLFNRMEMFQGFTLVSALVMILTNVIFLASRATKLISQKMKGTNETISVAAEKLKKINTYISTLNVSTMVVLTWHLAYIDQLLHVQH